MAAPAKPDTKEAASAAPAVSAAAGAPRGGNRNWLPAIVVILLAPAASWGVAEYVLLPRLRQKLAVPAAAATSVAAGDKVEVKSGPAVPPTYEFSDIVVNLAGTMGTRYLKTTFMISGSDPGLHAAFEEKKALLKDVTLNVLSSLTLSDLEEPGSKNVLREKLVTAYNQAFGRKVAEQVYFSDFVVQ